MFFSTHTLPINSCLSQLSAKKRSHLSLPEARCGQLQAEVAQLKARSRELEQVSRDGGKASQTSWVLRFRLLCAV